MIDLQPDRPRLGLLGLTCTPLTEEELESVYAATDWRVVHFFPGIQRAYGRFPPVKMFKALALPYLLNIESEQALARELAEKESLRALCGFAKGATPTRPVFWHFRHTPRGLYPDVMVRVLAALVLSGQRPNLDLPFVTPVPQNRDLPLRDAIVIQLDTYRPSIELWASWPTEDIQTAGKTVGELYRQVNAARVSRPKRALSSQLPLPVQVRTRLIDGEVVGFAIDRPEWLRDASGYRIAGKDTLTTVGLFDRPDYDAACNVMVIREHDARTHVLLSRRLGPDGRGQYALPGGKAKGGESLEGCSLRELLEETGLHALCSRPVSIRRVRSERGPPVFSIGAIVEDYEGVPRQREPLQHSLWEWFDLDRLPAPLFPPTQMVLDDYRRQRFPDLQWSDVETQRPSSTLSVVQLPLYGQLGGADGCGRA